MVRHSSDVRRATDALAQLPAALARVRNLAGVSREDALRAPRDAYDEEVRRRGLELLAQAPPSLAPPAQDQWDVMAEGPSTSTIRCEDVSDDEPDLPELVSASDSD